PGPGSDGRRQALTDQHGAAAVRQRRPPAYQLRPRLDERPPRADLPGRDRQARELAEPGDRAEAPGVVPVGRALEARALPALAGRGGDPASHSRLGAPVADPAGAEAGLDEDDVRARGVDPSGQRVWAGREGGEAWRRVGASKAGDALVLAEVE